MIRNLFSTTASRLIIALINLCSVWLIARFMGATVLGTVSLIILGMSIIQMFTAILAGSSLVYQASRKSVAELLVAGWIWIPLSGLPVWACLLILKLIPDGYVIDVFLLSLLGSLVTINQNLFLGKEKISYFNGIAILQSFLMVACLLVFMFAFKWYEVSAYVTAQYISMIICFITGMINIMPPLKEFRFPRWQTITEAFSFGGYLQTASIMQLLNYRLSYYLIEKFFDRATLGVYSLGVQIAESVWIIAKSMAVLLYSRLSNSRDPQYSAMLTNNFIKVVTILTVVLMLIIISLPENLFTFIFRSEFGKITSVIGGLSPGIIAIAISLMLSHYFSGTGKPYYNAISSGIGLIFTVVLGFLLIPLYGLTGAALTASASYLSSMIFQLIVFKNTASLTWRSFIPCQSDFKRMKEELLTLFKTT
ncbi:MAG TPA: polysaccharide biosynthesis C-terminal domain-containing protein [Lentimicrobium sp.]|nr:polysaccharide biosynthesis C-terminal domain-containing protein [Lentimicrobium sp.]